MLAGGECRWHVVDRLTLSIVLLHVIQAMAQHRLGEARRLCRQGGDDFGRAFGERPPEGRKLDLGDEVHAAGHRTQRVGQALFFPAIGLAMFGIEQSQRSAAGRKLTPRDVISAVAIGLGAGLGTTLVFQNIFLVRLP